MDARLFGSFSALVYETSGITLRQGKETLLQARIAKRIRELELSGPEEYLALLHRDRGGDEMTLFLDAISTNFTSFFRERDHFALLTEETKGWRDGARVRVWCAASSTGEEPYTIAMTLAEALGERIRDWKILATDISTRALAQARAGRYGPTALEPVGRALATKYFTRVDGSGDLLEASAALRSRITFARLNLARPPFPMRGPLDLVMCRNVMIYFDEAVRQALVSEAERLLRPGALFVVGHSETLNGLRTSFVPVRPSVYRKPVPS